ncbi:type II secretion system protein N [Dokdonella soli]|uniref:Type II secretion system protein GspC n=1 Tax=Dokdonella soli TaxID=529810 RepID=A0ABN1J0E7_9GAMM
MLGRLSGIDRGRRAETAALLCCAVLAALALWLLVRMIWTLVPRGDAAFDSAPVRIGSDTAGAAPAQSIASWHLFGNTPLRPGAGGSAPATTLSLILRGTVADGDPKLGVAVIADAGNGERAWRVGEEVAPGVRLGGVYPDHIVLIHDGAEETLKLPRDQNLAPADIVRPTPASATSRSAPNPRADAPVQTGSAVPAGAPQAVKAPSDWQQTVARLRQNPDELMKRVQVVPVLDGGKLTGVRLSAGADAALISQIGLRPGDVVTAVNGMPVDSFARGQQILSSLGSASSVRVTVLRDGKPTELTVGLQ